MADSKTRECHTCGHYDIDSCACLLHQSLHFPFEVCDEWSDLPKIENANIRPRNSLDKDSCLLLVYEVGILVRCVECKLFASRVYAMRYVHNNRDGYEDKRVVYMGVDQDNGYVASFVACNDAQQAEGGNDGR